MMAPLGRGRTRPASATDAVDYLAKATEFLRAAQDAQQLGNHTAATSNAVHAGIAAADAIAAACSRYGLAVNDHLVVGANGEYSSSLSSR